MRSILIIGCGSIGERHLRCFLQTGRTTVTACDANPVLLQRVVANYGVVGIADANVALRGSFDAAVICTPAHLHVPMAAQALREGKHVLIEKPLSHSLAGLDELFRLQAQSGKQVAVAYIYRVIPFLAEAAAYIAGGELGEVLQITATSGQPFHLLRPAYAETYYRDRRMGGGAIQDALTHLANWIEGVVGATDTVTCDCAHVALPGVEVEDTVHVMARHGRVLVSYSLNQFQAPNETTLQLNTARGSIKIEFHRQRWGTFTHGAADWEWRQSPPAERDSHFTRQAGAFLDQIEGRPAGLCSLIDAAQTLRFNLAALASAERGTRVACAENFG